MDSIERSNGTCEKARVPCKTLISEESSLPEVSNNTTLSKFGSASARFKRMTEEKDQISPSIHTSSSNHNLKERISLVFSKKIEWTSLMKLSNQWLKSPLNMALSLWILVITISGSILFMVMTGMLNNVIPKKSQRDVWFEVNNQILNALFTLMCLYQHPKRFYHLVILFRWKQEDVITLRSVYSENGSYKPNEWIHMMVVVLLLHLNCLAQYGLCGLNLGFRRSERPVIGVALCISIAIAAPVIAGLYTIFSPLGKHYEEDDEDEENRIQSDERRFDKISNWRGGVLDIWEDISVSCLSLFCTFFVFGYNMERIGFGNMYVHIATFMLLCSAPFFIFSFAAVNIDDEVVREGLGYIGIVLCLFGLLYGGFWRIQMRKRFELPSYNFCFGKPEIADCTLWLFCCWCSLAQEVRTMNSYDDDDKESKIDEVLDCDDGLIDSSGSPKKMTMTMDGSSIRPEGLNEEESCLEDKSDEALTHPPSPLSINREC